MTVGVAPEDKSPETACALVRHAVARLGLAVEVTPLTLPWAELPRGKRWTNRRKAIDFHRAIGRELTRDGGVPDCGDGPPLGDRVVEYRNLVGLQRRVGSIPEGWWASGALDEIRDPKDHFGDRHNRPLAEDPHWPLAAALADGKSFAAFAEALESALRSVAPGA